MNDSTCNITLTWPASVNNVFLIYSVLLLVLGLLLNGVALWVFCYRMHQWTETRVYMTNLAVADLCLLCSLPFVLYSLKSSTSDTPICQLSQGIYLVNRYMSISLVTAIAVDRYVAVRHPLRARELRSPRQAAAVCVSLWVIVVTSLVVRWRLGIQEGGFCFSSQGQHFISTTFSLLGFYLPLAIVVFCSLQVVTVLARRPTTDVGQAEATRKATHMVWANLAVFIICFLPLHVVLTIQISLSLNTCAARGTFIRALTIITAKLSDTNCCLDAICYYYMAKEFQEASMPATSSKTHPKSQDSQSLSLP